LCNAVNRAGRLEQWWEGFRAKVKKTDIDALNMLAMAACYSPDASAPMGIALPVDLYTCKLDDAVWARWLGWDPVYLAARYSENLKNLRLLYMDCGTRDEYNLHFGARIMAETLTGLGVSYRHEEFDDGHGSVQYRYSVSLPLLASALQPD
jgi:hypothetical protein